MIETGVQLSTFINGLNLDADIDPTLLEVLVGTAQATLEEERDWKVLKKTNTSLSATTASTWQTEYSLSGITDFSRFYGDFPIRVFDGDNRIEYFHQVPWDRRLEFKDINNTFVHDANSGKIYLNGSLSFSGTVYLNYVATLPEIDLSSESAIWTVFPKRFRAVLGFYAIGIYKGAVDYDSINRQMLPENRATLQALKNAMEKWDNELQLNELALNDPTDMPYSGFRSGAIDIHD